MGQFSILPDFPMTILIISHGPCAGFLITKHSLKPVFHQNANPFALGPHVGLDPEQIDFSLGIRVHPRRTLIANASPNSQCKHQREQVEYSSHWALSRYHRVGHLDFMLFVLVLFALGTQCEHGFWWNTGLSFTPKICKEFVTNLSTSVVKERCVVT